MDTTPRRTILLICVAVALGSPVPGADSDAVPITETHVLGQPLVVEGLTVWPVFSSEPLKESLDALPLHTAQEQGLVTVRDSGNVNEVRIQNKGNVPVLILAGTLIKGGYQDRLLAVDLVVPAGTTLRVDAFCVESGRWSDRREGLATRGRFEAQPVLAPHAPRTSGQHAKSQQDVWKNVAVANRAARKTPRTGTLMASVEDKGPAALETRERIKAAVQEYFASIEMEGHLLVGLAYAIDGTVREVRIFAGPQLFGLHLASLINTLSVEADLAGRMRRASRSGKAIPGASTAEVAEMVQRARAIKESEVLEKAGNRIVTAQDDEIATSATYLLGEEAPVVVQYSKKP